MGKKKKNAASKRQESPDKASDTEIARDPSPPSKGHSLLSQIPRSFPSPRQPSNDDVLDELNRSEKISDEHTPPHEAFGPNTTFGRSPPSELIPGLSYAQSPPTQHGYIGKGGFNTRSPPISPPQAKARPISYGGRPSSNYGYPKLSTSPYAHPMPAYGSPPALPHLPQQHFYNAQDVDLRVGRRQTNIRSQPSTLLKFTRFPGGTVRSPDALFVGSEATLNIFSYDSEKFDQVGSLSQLPGVVHDAVFLTWNGGYDHFRELRPLVAVALHDATSLDAEMSGPADTQSSNHGLIGSLPSLSVVVYSLRTQAPIAELLRAPASEQQPFPAYAVSETPQKHRLSLQASGDHLLVSSAISGEVFVFGIGSEKPGMPFECLTKVWTARQPRMQRRDSSHGRSIEPEMSPADLNRGDQDGLRPIVSLNGRWLAYCPAATSSTSIAATLGDSIQALNSPAFISRSAPSRPTISCEVDSPDADTLLGKVARGAAQTIVRGSKWLGEMGMQAWRNWNTDPAANPSSQSTMHRSPIYSPQLAPSQFPPTHGDPIDAYSSEPELVSIIDLTSLSRMDGKKDLR